MAKNISKNLSGKNSQKRLDHAKICTTDALKTSSKRVIKFLKWQLSLPTLELQKFQKKMHNKIIQRQLQLRNIKKYLKKDELKLKQHNI